MSSKEGFKYFVVHKQKTGKRGRPKLVKTEGYRLSVDKRLGPTFKKGKKTYTSGGVEIKPRRKSRRKEGEL